MSHLPSRGTILQNQEQATWFTPGPSFGYIIREIDGHPWQALVTMKEILKLEPASIEFLGPNAQHHIEYWKSSIPHLLNTKTPPHFKLDTTPIHPHQVEVEPRKPFQPWKE
jgi:hypothetical protein